MDVYFLPAMTSQQSLTPIHLFSQYLLPGWVLIIASDSCLLEPKFPVLICTLVSLLETGLPNR